MPFKTRKRKESANEKRMDWSAASVSYRGIDNKKLDDKTQVKNHIEPVISGGELSKDFWAVRGDLIKIVVTSFIIISLQIFLKIGQAQHFLKF